MQSDDRSKEATGDIRSRRIALGIAQKDLAEQSHLSVSSLSRIERGLTRPSKMQVERLARVFDTSAHELVKAQDRYIEGATPGEGYTTVRAEQTRIIDRTVLPDSGRVPVLDLFCGCGGLSYGFDQTGYFAVTAGLDLLNDRIETFRRNHPHAVCIQGDIREFSRKKLASLAMRPKVIIGGPPCQGFSSIRPFRTLTERDPRNTLVEEFVLVVSQLRPEWFVFENVVGLLTHGRGRAFGALLQGFEDAGYKTDWRVVNMALLGLPQVRERLVVVGNRNGEVFNWPAPTHHYEGRSMAGNEVQRLEVAPLLDGLLPPAVTIADAIGDLPPVASGISAERYDDDMPASEYAKALRGDCERLTLHTATRHTEKMMEIIRLSGTNRSALPEGLTTSGFSSCYSRLEADRPSVTLTVNFVHPASNRCIHPDQDRALTPREGARLQGFPDHFEFAGTRAQIVKQIGNAVPPILGRAIADQLAKAFGLGVDQRVPRTSFSPADRPDSDRASNTPVPIG